MTEQLLIGLFCEKVCKSNEASFKIHFLRFSSGGGAENHRNHSDTCDAEN